MIWVEAVALIAADGRISLQKRRGDRRYGRLGEFPGGKIEPSETPGAAAVRENSEEPGARLEVSALHVISFASSAASALSHVLPYACRRWHGEPRCPDPETISWFTPEQPAHLAMPPLDYPLARALIGALHQHI